MNKGYRSSVREGGSALVAVLCLIFSAGLLTTMVLALAKTGSFTVAAHVELQRSMLIAEGVAARVQWLLAADNNLYPTRDPGMTDYDEYDYDRYLADGVEHELDYHGTPVRFTITDAVAGLDFSNESNATQALNALLSRIDDDDVLIEKLETLLYRVPDYMDTDTTPGEVDGMEEGEYEALGMEPLPRDNSPQFREELLWIPEFRDVIPVDRYGRLSGVRLIPAEGSGTLSGLPSLIAADETLLRTYTDFEDDEIAEVLEAIRLWKTERTPIDETLDEELLPRLSSFSWGESGNYTVIIEGGRESKRPFRSLVFSWEGFPIWGTDDGVIRYMEWMFL